MSQNTGKGQDQGQNQEQYSDSTNAPVTGYVPRIEPGNDPTKRKGDNVDRPEDEPKPDAKQQGDGTNQGQQDGNNTGR